MFVFYTENEIKHRLNSCPSNANALSEQIITELRDMFDEHNVLVKVFRYARDRLNAGGVENVKLKLQENRISDRREYDLPTMDELAILIVDETGDDTYQPDIIVQHLSNEMERNNDIWAQVPLTLEKMFRSKIQEQKIYIMKKFKVMPATGGFRPIQNKLIIQFTSSTTVGEIPEMRNAMSVVVHMEDTRVRRFGTKSTIVKNIKLQFTDGYVITVTLWGPLAIEMDKISDVAGDKITILIAAIEDSCHVLCDCPVAAETWKHIAGFDVTGTVWRGFVHLSTTSASKLYADLDIPEVQPLKAVYGTKKYPAISENVDVVTIEQLALLKSDNANKDKVFMVQCIVTGVNYGWSYNGCANDMCLRKIEDVMENYVCGFCDHKMLKTVAKYRVSMNVFDSTGTAEFILLDKEGVKYYGIKAEDLLSSLNGIDTDEPPAVLLSTVGKNLTFLIKLTSYAMNRKRSEFTISKILDGASKSEKVVDKEHKDDISGAHSSSQSLSSCVVQNEILTKADASPSHSTNF
ncbi:hypothetical protein LINPERHAP1_LOCUS23222 [Linum perenne]